MRSPFISDQVCGEVLTTLAKSEKLSDVHLAMVASMIHDRTCNTKHSYASWEKRLIARLHQLHLMNKLKICTYTLNDAVALYRALILTGWDFEAVHQGSDTIVTLITTKRPEDLALQLRNCNGQNKFQKELHICRAI